MVQFVTLHSHARKVPFSVSVSSILELHDGERGGCEIILKHGRNHVAESRSVVLELIEKACRKVEVFGNV